ncbi:hypothetical protein SAMN05444410_12426 [Hydrobacter penzbergensis]|uniref:Uncharacterized protein n=1 Tax=Hydrobacter penzbergensis TaxID=1235997 RepID=A0A8X8IIR2_9BACT|nr:hypothetical protein [Hydrobacter penzbergensis]SDX67033.1 hypothetical protein SAMN05444410_12426 [Hydrobacter penzbergensis]
MEKTNKEYKVTYKTYFNERLKKSQFHTRLMHPLYVQVIFDRIPIIFKSYYFDLFSKPKYAIRLAGQVFTPDIKEIIKKEEALIEFIIGKNRDNFSLELFKKEYAFYCRDLLDLMEADFLDYLFTFLHDEGLPALADTIKKGAGNCKAYDIVRDMKSAFNDKTYNTLIENSFYYAPPYLPLYAFAEKPKSTPFTCFTVREWEQPSVKDDFAAFFKKRYPGKQVEDAMLEIQKRVDKN